MVSSASALATVWYVVQSSVVKAFESAPSRLMASL